MALYQVSSQLKWLKEGGGGGGGLTMLLYAKNAGSIRVDPSN